MSMATFLGKKPYTADLPSQSGTSSAMTSMMKQWIDDEMDLMEKEIDYTVPVDFGFNLTAYLNGQPSEWDSGTSVKIGQYISKIFNNVFIDQKNKEPVRKAILMLLSHELASKDETFKQPFPYDSLWKELRLNEEFYLDKTIYEVTLEEITKLMTLQRVQDSVHLQPMFSTFIVIHNRAVPLGEWLENMLKIAPECKFGGKYDPTLLYKIIEDFIFHVKAHTSSLHDNVCVNIGRLASVIYDQLSCYETLTPVEDEERSAILIFLLSQEHEKNQDKDRFDLIWNNITPNPLPNFKVKFNPNKPYPYDMISMILLDRVQNTPYLLKALLEYLIIYIGGVNNPPNSLRPYSNSSEDLSIHFRKVEESIRKLAPHLDKYPTIRRQVFRLIDAIATTNEDKYKELQKPLSKLLKEFASYLTVLDLSYNVNPYSAEKMAELLPNANKAIIDGNPSIWVLGSLKNLKKLTCLDITITEDIVERGWQLIAELPCLEDLRIHKGAGRGNPSLSNMPHINLKRLTLDCIPFPNDAVTIFTKMTNLEFLDLSTTGGYLNQIEFLASLSGLKELRVSSAVLKNSADLIKELKTQYDKLNIN